MNKKIGVLLLAGILCGSSSCDFNFGDISLPNTTTNETSENNEVLVSPKKFLQAAGFDVDIDTLLQQITVNENVKDIIIKLMSKVESIIKGGVSVEITQNPSDKDGYLLMSELSIDGLTTNPIVLTLYYNLETSTETVNSNYEHHHGHEHEDWDQEDWEEVEADKENGEDVGTSTGTWDDFDDTWEDGDHRNGGPKWSSISNGNHYGEVTQTSADIKGIALLGEYSLSFAGNATIDENLNSSLDIVLSTSETTYVDLRASHFARNNRIEDELAFTFVNDGELIVDLGAQIEINKHKCMMEFYLNGLEIQVTRKVRQHGSVVYEIEVTSEDGTTKKYRFKRVISVDDVTNEESVTFVECN